MRTLTTDTAPIDFIAGYGPNWRQGLLTEHIAAFEAAGGLIREGRATAGWAVIEGRAYPLLCSGLVQIDTEDGPVSGRCGELARPDTGSCGYPYH